MYVPTTSNSNPLGKEIDGDEHKFEHIIDFYNWLEEWICGSCKTDVSLYVLGTENNLTPAKTIGDLLRSSCAAELWFEEDEEIDRGRLLNKKC